MMLATPYKGYAALHRPTARSAAPRLVPHQVPVLARPPSVARVASPSVIRLPKEGQDQDWLKGKLNDMLAGVQHLTRRVHVTTTRVLHVSRAVVEHSKVNNKPRCTCLDMDLAWEAEPTGSPAPGLLNSIVDGDPKRVKGMARVRLTTKGSCVRVSVTDIQVLDAEDAATPAMPSSKPGPPEVLLAVESMDSVIMEHLNDFMWEVENLPPGFSLASFECETDDKEDDHMADMSMGGMMPMPA